MLASAEGASFDGGLGVFLPEKLRFFVLSRTIGVSIVSLTPTKYKIFFLFFARISRPIFQKSRMYLPLQTSPRGSAPMPALPIPSLTFDCRLLNVLLLMPFHDRTCTLYWNMKQMGAQLLAKRL